MSCFPVRPLHVTPGKRLAEVPVDVLQRDHVHASSPCPHQSRLILPSQIFCLSLSLASFPGSRFHLVPCASSPPPTPLPWSSPLSRNRPLRKRKPLTRRLSPLPRSR